MRKEAVKCEPLCKMCHALDPSSSSSEEKRCDPSTLKREDYDSDKKFRDAKFKAKYREEKREFNNELKRKVGVCERPDCPGDGPSDGKCTEGYEQCYDWDHIDPSKKEHGIAKLVNDSKSPKTVCPIIKSEVKKCRLLCKNCHNTRAKWDREDAQSEAGTSASHAASE